MRRFFAHTLNGLIMAALVLCAMTAAQAQDREKHVISAKAGGVNTVSGRVLVKRKDSTDWVDLTSKDDLDRGDVVKTEANGLIELLLNPGSYMRVHADSEFELTDTSLEALRVRLSRGSAIVEATGADKAELLINVDTPNTQVSIIKRGLYRINVLPANTTEVLVRKGRAQVGSNPLTTVKDGDKVIVSNGTTEVVKLDKKNLDALDLWSKQRAETLAQANRRLTNRSSTLLSSFVDPYSAQFRRPFYGHGLWYYDSTLRYSTFLPFYSGWGSPYGYGYVSDPFWRYPCCGGRGYPIFLPLPGVPTITRRTLTNVPTQTSGNTSGVRRGTDTLRNKTPNHSDNSSRHSRPSHDNSQSGGGRHSTGGFGQRQQSQRMSSPSSHGPARTRSPH